MMFRLSPAGSLALAALLSAAPASAQTPTYRVTEITGAAGTVCAATALNDSGMTAGACVAMERHAHGGVRPEGHAEQPRFAAVRALRRGHGRELAGRHGRRR